MPNDLALHGDSPTSPAHTPEGNGALQKVFSFCFLRGVASAVWQRAHQFALMISAGGSAVQMGQGGRSDTKKGAKVKIKQN